LAVVVVVVSAGLSRVVEPEVELRLSLALRNSDMLPLQC